MLPLAARRQQRALMAAEGFAAAAVASEHRIERLRESALLGQERQQELARHRRVLAEMIEPGGDDGLGLGAVDQRHAERRVRMHPAGHHQAARMAGKQADQPAGHRSHQHGAGVGAEHRSRREREGRLVEHVGLDRGGGQRPPFVGDRSQLGETSPLDLIGLAERRVHGRQRPQMKTWKPSRRLVMTNSITDSTTSAVAVATAAPSTPIRGISTMPSATLSTKAKA